MDRSTAVAGRSRSGGTGNGGAVGADRTSIRCVRFAAAALALLLTAACDPTVNTHGQVWRGVLPGDIEVGVDTRETVLQRLGTPTAEGLEQGAPWIYVSERVMVRGARPEESLEHRAVVIRFDAGGRVVSVEELGPEDRMEVALSGRETPTRGRSLSLIQQLLGNVGRFESQ